MGRESSSSWPKYGCLTTLALGVIALVVLGMAAGIALRQNRSAAFERQTVAHEIEETEAAGDLSASVRLNLEIHTAGVSIRPIGAGESIRIEADYDPRLHVLRQSSRRDGRIDVVTVELRPLGSKLMALLRAKVGGRLAMLRIALPRDVPLEIEGSVDRGLAVMELGGLYLTSTRLEVEDGSVKLSFAEPLPTPMDKLRIIGNRGSLSVAGLGNASPRESVLLQHIGAVDLDLRGAWSRDAKVRVIAGAAGGSLWLPDNVNVTGLDERRGIRVEEDRELPQPTLDLSITEHMGRFVVME